MKIGTDTSLSGNEPLRPGITVVIPVYNRADQIKETLAGLESQTRRPERVILVDNRSTDNSAGVLHDWQHRMEALGWSVLVLEEARRGAAAARQTALGQVETEFVMFYDSDDWMPVRYVEDAMEDMTSSQHPDIACWSVKFISPGGRVSSRRVFPSDPLMNHFVQGLLSTQGYAVRTSYLRRCGGWNPDIGGWDDLELGVRLLLGNPRIHIDPRPRAEVRVQPLSITGTGYAHRAGDWERTLDEISRNVSASSHPRCKDMLRLIAYRRIILAAHYRREGLAAESKALRRLALSDPSLNTVGRLLLRIAYSYTAAGLPWAGAVIPPLLLLGQSK